MGVVVGIPHVNGVISTDLFVIKVLSSSNFINKLSAHLAFQLLHNLATRHSSFTVQPHHGVAFMIPIALPLPEGVVSQYAFWHSPPHFVYHNTSS